MIASPSYMVTYLEDNIRVMVSQARDSKVDRTDTELDSNLWTYCLKRNQRGQKFRPYFKVEASNKTATCNGTRDIFDLAREYY